MSTKDISGNPPRGGEESAKRQQKSNGTSKSVCDGIGKAKTRQNDPTGQLE